ncbi:alpha/beta hydrolase [Erythrobacter sp. F6033]|uniref:alpha/beta fold hydrolase n=1 Tax=Erythrobacter sp. F6033 TaxID=2926401 RepID=UPI001FF65B44|nr:alpha/beta hydrolase [Erythrobacter sp. F6033]MCK0128897.1 alpha/beta hydrolase [Erythrobacter sp. F6033]
MKWFIRILAVLVALLVILFLVFRTPDTDAGEMRAKYGSEPSQFVEIGDGVTVHLRDEGPRDAPTIILLHGSNSDLHTWDEWAAGLSDTYRVIRFDQVGHGLTGPDADGDYTRANYVEDIREVADAVGAEQFVLGGNSMGGKHALAFASTYPERLTGLVLVDASGGAIPQDHKDDDDSGNIGFTIAMTPGINKIAGQITPRSLIAQSLEQSVSVQSVVDDAMIDRYWELLRYPGNRGATMARFSVEREPLSNEQVAAITLPTLIQWGDEDRLIPLAAGEWLDATMPNSKLVVYNGIGHLPQKEVPAETIADVRAWLAELGSAE